MLKKFLTKMLGEGKQDKPSITPKFRLGRDAKRSQPPTRLRLVRRLKAANAFVII